MNDAHITVSLVNGRRGVSMYRPNAVFVSTVSKTRISLTKPVDVYPFLLIASRKYVPLLVKPPLSVPTSCRTSDLLLRLTFYRSLSSGTLGSCLCHWGHFRPILSLI